MFKANDPFEPATDEKPPTKLQERVELVSGLIVFVACIGITGLMPLWVAPIVGAAFTVFGATHDKKPRDGTWLASMALIGAILFFFIKLGH